MILRRSSRTDPRLVLGSALAFVLPLGADLAAIAQTPSNQPLAGTAQAPAAQVPPALTPAPAAPTGPPTSDADALKQHDQELDAARAEQRMSAETQEKLKREIEVIGDDRRALNH